MRICIVTSSFRRYEGDYAGQHVYAQAVGLSRKHDVYVIYPTDRDNPDAVSDPFHHLAFKYPFKTYPMAQVRGPDIFNLFRLFIRMQREMIKAKRRYNIDLFYAFWTIPSGFICSLMCSKTPYILNVAGADDKVFGRGGIARPCVKRALNKAAKVISLSQELKNDAISMGTGEEDIYVIPSGINIDEYKPRVKMKVRAELGLPDTFTIIYAGSLFKLKRIEWLIRLSAELGRTHKFLSLIIGDGPEKEELQELAKQLHADNVRFLGHVPYKKVPLYISASNVLVLFSETEGLPSVVQEALASGVPVVATDVGGVRDIVHQGMTGYVINNEQEATACLIHLIESPRMVDHMGIIARKYAEIHLSHEHVFQQVSAVCESVLDAGKKSQNMISGPEEQDPESSVKRPNIGIISTFPSYFISYLIEVQTPYVQNIHVIAPDLNRNGIDFHKVKYRVGVDLFSQVFNQISAQTRMAYEIFKLGHKVDFWIFVGGDVFLLPMLTARLKGIPTMLSILGNLEFETSLKNNALNPLQRIIKKVNCYLANRIIIYSDSLAKKWNLNRYEFKTLVAQSQFVNLKQFKITTPLSRRNKVIGYVGRLSPEKGVWNLVKSMPRILQEDADVRLLIVGNGPLYSNIKQYLETDNLKEKIHLTGKVPYEQIPDWMNELRLLVLPSFSEGLPATILEAMACGTPVLATPVGAVDEIITSEKTGFLLENNSQESITRGIMKALNHPEGESIAYAARKLIEEEYSLVAAQRNYQKVIAEGSLLKVRKINSPAENLIG